MAIALLKCGLIFLGSHVALVTLAFLLFASA
jgi:hypothetical protein